MRLFKKYALELVNAAAIPLLRNEDIMNGGCECTSGVKKDENLSAVDAILAIMSIAKDYYYELQFIRILTDLSKFEPAPEFVENTRKILAVIERSSLYFDRGRTGHYFRPYLLKYKRGLMRTAPSTGAYDANLESAMKCHLTKRSFSEQNNDGFFAQLAHGSYIARVLMKSDDDDWENDSRQDVLQETIDSMREYRLSNSGIDFSKEELKAFLEMMSL